MNPTLYMPIAATIEHIKDETPDIRTYTIRPVEPVPFKAGQFVELAVPGIGEAPFTPSSSPSITDHMEITIMRTGRVTDWLHQMKVGDEVGLRGRAYPIEDFHGREILIVGGGCGVGPLRSLLLALVDDLDCYARIVVRYGAKTPDSIVFRDAQMRGWDVGGKGGGPLDVMLTVDSESPGWDGHVGMITTILTEDFLDRPAADGRRDVRAAGDDAIRHPDAAAARLPTRKHLSVDGAQHELRRWPVRPLPARPLLRMQGRARVFLRRDSEQPEVVG